MNLIEQLGGYKKAKREFELKEQNSVLQCCSAVTAEMIRDALLEYRRQHNIFEVGDLVVEVTDYPCSDVLTVKSISDKLLVCENDDLNASYVLSKRYKPSFYVRHATDAEIAAGKRL